MQNRLTQSKINIDKELIILLLLVALACFIYFFIVNQRAFLNVFYLPVLLGAYFFGKRYAIISSTLSVAIILIMAWVFPHSFALQTGTNATLYKWLDLDRKSVV